MEQGEVLLTGVCGASRRRSEIPLATCTSPLVLGCIAALYQYKSFIYVLRDLPSGQPLEVSAFNPIAKSSLTDGRTKN